jgi:hypothetical protein
MPWQDATSVSFTHIDIVSRIPSESGVYGIHDGECCIFIGESWNLKARLLELASALSEVAHLRIVYELCPEEQRSERKAALSAEVIGDRSDQGLPVPQLPGVLFSTFASR